jgi:CRP/FNR family transcriptional regulator, cyclic AMP receptor protein
VIPYEFLKTAQTDRVLSTLDRQQLRKLLPIAEERQYKDGQSIFRGGDKPSFLHLIVSGEVALEGVGGLPVHVQTIQVGEAMGWSALTAGAHTHFQAQALWPVSTVSFPRARIREACDRDPAIGYAPMKRLLDPVTERVDAMRMQLAHKGKSEALPRA